MSIFHRGQHADRLPAETRPVPPDITEPHTRPGITLLQAPETIPFPPRRAVAVPVPAPPRALPAPLPRSSPMAAVAVAVLTGEVIYRQGQDQIHLLNGETPRVSNDGHVLPPEDTTRAELLDKTVAILARDRPPRWEPAPIPASLRELWHASMGGEW